MSDTKGPPDPTAVVTGYAFPRAFRLTCAAEFERALRHPDLRRQAGALRLVAVRNRMHTARLGLIVGKKAVPQAHARNRIKRIVRNRFRLSRRGLGAIDIVVRVTASVTDEGLHRALDSLILALEKETVERSADA